MFCVFQEHIDELSFLDVGNVSDDELLSFLDNASDEKEEGNNKTANSSVSLSWNIYHIPWQQGMVAFLCLKNWVCVSFDYEFLQQIDYPCDRRKGVEFIPTLL